MDKQEFRNWVGRLVAGQHKATLMSLVGMIALALVLFVVQGGLLYLIFGSLYDSTAAGVLVVLIFFGGLGAWTWVEAPKQLTDSEYVVETGFTKQRVRVAPALSHAWTFAMGSTETDQNFAQRILNVALLVPRLLWTALYLYNRLERVRQIDVDTCASALRMIVKKSERVNVSEIAERFPDIDLPRLIYDLSLIDGIVFLTREQLGITLARRFRDKLEAAQDASGTSVADSPSLLDG